MLWRLLLPPLTSPHTTLRERDNWCQFRVAAGDFVPRPLWSFPPCPFAVAGHVVFVVNQFLSAWACVAGLVWSGLVRLEGAGEIWAGK